MKRKYLLTIAATLLTFACLTGCGKNSDTANTPVITEKAATEISDGGILCLRVNPEIAVHYDNKGLVTMVEARNDDGKTIVRDYTDYVGKETHEVVKELVTAIGEAGYFIEEVEGESKQITIEIEVGSKIPDNTFIDEVVSEIKNCVNENDWSSPIFLEGNSDYGITDYDDTDYGTGSDNVTDYNNTDYGAGNDNVTDYNDTDYDITDYGTSNNSATDYNNPAPVPAPEPAPTPVPNLSSDYGNTDYDDGNSNYDDGNSDYDDGNSDYIAPAPEPAPAPVPNPSSDYGNTDYDDGNSNYDDGSSDYNDGNSDYDNGSSDYDNGNSDYDDGNSDYDDGSSDYDD